MTASTFRMFLDRDKAHQPATEKEVVEGAVFLHKNIEYTVIAVLDPETVKLEGMNGLARRSTIVSVSQLTKPGSEYRLLRRTYYRLYDRQTGRYMSTGYNAESMQDLREQYISYISIDTEDKYLTLLGECTDQEFAKHVNANEFTIERSNTPFDPSDES